MIIASGRKRPFAYPVTSPWATSGDRERRRVGSAEQTDQLTNNQTFTVTATGESVQIRTATATSTIRTYTAKVPSGTTSVNIRLYNASAVATTGTETTFSAATSDPTDVNLVVANGVPTAAVQQIQNVAVQNGQVTFGINFVNNANTVPNVVPVVYAGSVSATSPAGLTGASSASRKAPTVAFGVGPATRFMNAYFAGGTVGGVQEILYVDKTANIFATAAATYRYDDNDTYYVGTADAFANYDIPRGLSYFEDRLTVGDSLLDATTGTVRSTVFAADAAQVSVIHLQNNVPGLTGTISQQSVATTSMQLTIADVAASGSPTVTVYGGPTDTITRANAPVLVSTSTDANSSVAGFQVNITGLAANTAYEFWATQTIGGEQSARFPANDTGAAHSTSAAATPAATGVTYVDNGADGTGALNSLLDQGDRLDFAFNSGITVAAAWSVTLRDDAGRTVSVSNTGGSTAQVVGASNTVLRVTVGANDPTLVSGIGDFNDAQMQVLSSTGISNATGAWNLPGSSARQIAGTQNALVAGEVTLDAGDDTVAVAANDELANVEYTIRVYTMNGVLVGSATAIAAADGEFAATAIGGNLVDTTEYRVTYHRTSGDTRHSASVTKAATP